MLTLERQLQLEGRLVKILVTVLLASWLCGLFAVNSIISGNVALNESLSEQAHLTSEMQKALWVVEDERLAIKSCYNGRWGSWRANVRHLDTAPESF